MKTLAEFETLQDARDYPYITYRKIGGNEASQILFVLGALDDIEGEQSNTTSIEVIQGIPTTVGAACRTIVRTINGGQFSTDPNTKDGQFNRAATQALVSAGVLEQFQADGFFAEAESTTNPYANVSQYEWKKARGESIPLKEVTPVNGWLKITLTADCEAHRPQVYADVQGIKQRVTGFGAVEKAGDYLAEVPRGYAVLYVDDCYGVVA